MYRVNYRINRDAIRAAAYPTTLPHNNKTYGVKA